MAFFSDTEQSSNQGVDVVFDIRSGSVGVCLVSADEQTPKIHWSDRFSVDFLAEHDTDRLLKMTKNALNKAVSTAHEDGLSELESDGSNPLCNIYCYFAAPWQIGSPQEITIQDDNEFTVTQNRLELAKEKAEKMFLDDALERHGTHKENLTKLSTALLAFWCNGYRLKNPHQVGTKNLRVSTYVSMLPRRVRQVTEEVISKTFHLDRLSCHSFTAAIQRAFTKHFSHPKTFLVVNVDEEMTQLLIVNSGVLMGSVSYPVGSHFLIRQLAKKLGVPAGDAKSRLYQYQNEEAESRTAQDIERILTQTKERWQDLLVDSLGEFSADVSIPEYAFVLANHDVSGTFREFTQDVEVGQHLLRTDGFRVHEVSDDLLQIHVQSQQDHTDHYLSIAGLIHEHTKKDVI